MFLFALLFGLFALFLIVFDLNFGRDGNQDLNEKLYEVPFNKEAEKRLSVFMKRFREEKVSEHFSGMDESQVEKAVRKMMVDYHNKSVGPLFCLGSGLAISMPASWGSGHTFSTLMLFLLPGGFLFFWGFTRYLYNRWKYLSLGLDRKLLIRPFEDD